MNVLAMRIRAHMKAEREEVAAEVVRLVAQHQKLLKQAKVIVDQQQGVYATLEAEARLNAKQVKFIDGLPRLARIERELDTINNEVITLRARAVTLNTDAEFNRRLKLAKRIGATDEPIPGPKAAQMVLEHTGKAMSVPEVTRVLLESGLVSLTGKTPEQTISAYLAKSHTHGGQFVRISKGSYTLRDAVEAGS